MNQNKDDVEFQKAYFQYSRTAGCRSALNYESDVKDRFAIGLYEESGVAGKAELQIDIREERDPKLTIYRDGFELFDEMSELFDRLSELKPQSADEIRDLLDDLQYQDFSDVFDE